MTMEEVIEAARRPKLLDMASIATEGAEALEAAEVAGLAALLLATRLMAAADQSERDNVSVLVLGLAWQVADRVLELEAAP